MNLKKRCYWSMLGVIFISIIWLHNPSISAQTFIPTPSPRPSTLQEKADKLDAESFSDPTLSSSSTYDDDQYQLEDKTVSLENVLLSVNPTVDMLDNVPTLERLLEQPSSDLTAGPYILFHHSYFSNKGLVKHYRRLIEEDELAGQHIDLDVSPLDEGWLVTANYSSQAEATTRQIVHYLATNFNTIEAAESYADDIKARFPDLIKQTQVYLVEEERYDIMFLAYRFVDLEAFVFDGNLNYKGLRPSFAYLREKDESASHRDDPIMATLDEGFQMRVDDIADSPYELVRILNAKDYEQLLEIEAVEEERYQANRRTKVLVDVIIFIIVILGLLLVNRYFKKGNNKNEET